MTGLTSSFLEDDRTDTCSVGRDRSAVPSGIPVLAVVGEPLVEVAFLDGFAPVVDAAGDVANTALTAARLGVRVRLGCRIGNDGGGAFLKRFWDDEEVDDRWVTADAAAPTGLYVNAVIEGRPNMTYYRHGSAGSRLVPADLPSAFFVEVALVHTSGITASISHSAAATAGYAFETAAEGGALRSFALNYRAALKPDPDALRVLAGSADFVFASEEDLTALFGSSQPDRLVELCRPDAELVISYGAAPAVLITAGARAFLEPPSTDVVDTTGAGDSLAGAYLARRLNGQEPVDALEVALDVASRSCQTLGCATALPPLRTEALDPLGHPPG